MKITPNKNWLQSETLELEFITLQQETFKIFYLKKVSSESIKMKKSLNLINSLFHENSLI